MPERTGRFKFYSHEEAEEMGLVPPTAAELAASDEMFEEFTRLGATLPPRQGSPGLGLGAKWFIDDMVGTEFEGWTHDPATDTWRDAHGRPAYDENGQRIHYPDTPNTPREGA
jgi:hypothetical protein